jgi:hypothetical protein
LILLESLELSASNVPRHGRSRAPSAMTTQTILTR